LEQAWSNLKKNQKKDHKKGCSKYLEATLKCVKIHNI